MSFSAIRLLLVVALALTTCLLIIPVRTLRHGFGLLLAGLAGWLFSSTLAAKRETKPIAPTAETQSPQQFALTRLFEATMNGMREGLIVVDQHVRVIASNRAAHQLFPMIHEAPGSQRLTELTRNTQIYNAFTDPLTDRTERSALRVEMPNGRTFDLRVVPLADVDGLGSPGALGVFFDITRLERLERVRQEFLSNVSHELRTPLTAIIAFVETLETGDVDDKESRQRFLEIIRKNASRMQDLIDDILELSAIEAGNVPVKPEKIALQPIVHDVINSVTAKATARSITIINNVDAAVIVFADGRRLEQMLTNLIDNAIKFNREGGRIIVTHTNGERDRIHVSDTGDGIPSQHLPRLFERFYRVDRARSRDLGGTGLGLAIVKHLAKAHGGEVTVQSTLGDGSVFTIDLPHGSGDEIRAEAAPNTAAAHLAG